ncbi:hypothetical protein AK830_g5028 [Neonectria ditissima]|uniref:Uncharacterized protein n=1 Tax=Neonectria ditissima TaxID=78410 RepID=A0A0P7AUL0_9HYPO|nr:hypothetical protein AK830_g5028 [Neonectria ditissima]
MRASMVHRSARTFSSTPVFGLKAIFTETDNSELNEVLKNIQEKIIFPAYLPEKQRELIFNAKAKTYLQQNPVVIELDGLEHKFTTLDRFHDIPNSKAALFKVLDSMKTKEDWDNLGTLLAGYKKAGIKVRPAHYMKIIRQAGHNGQIYSVIESVKQAQKTGFELTSIEYIIQLLCHISSKITTAAPGDAKSVDALRWTEEIIDLIQRPPHVNETLSAAKQGQNHPLVRGQLLFAQASVVESLKLQEKPFDKELADLTDTAEALVSWWARRVKEGEETSIPPFISKLRSHKPDVKRANRGQTPTFGASEWVRVLALNIKGMSLARELIGDAAKGLEPIEQKLEDLVRESVEDMPKFYTKSAAVYEEVTGRKPTWPAPTEPAAEPTVEPAVEA